MPNNEPSVYLFFNGLGNGEHLPVRHRLVLANMYWHGKKRFRTGTDWYSRTSFQQHLDSATKLAEGLLSLERNGLALVGSSAGVSLATNVFGRLAEAHPDLWLINLPGRVSRGKLKPWDWRTLAWASHTNRHHPVPAFAESVEYCEDVTLPALEERKNRIFSFYNPMDTVVPAQTMRIPDLPSSNEQMVLAPGHGLGIFVAGLLLPAAVTQLVNSGSK